MKYYYDGKLVRTSKRDTYKYGVLLPSGELWHALSSKRESLQRQINSEIKFFERQAAYFEKQLASEKSDYNKECLEEAKRGVNQYKQAKIVELEVQE